MADDFTQWGVVGGSYGYWQATVDSNWRLSETAGFRVNGMWHTADNFRDDNESDAWAINPTLSWSFDRTDLTLSLERVRNEFEPDGGLPIVAGRIADVDRSRSYDADSDFFEQGVTRLQLNLRHELSDRLELRSKLFFTELDWQSDGTILAGAFPLGPSAVVARTQSRLDDRQTFYGLQAELAREFETGGVTHEVLVGLEVAQLNDDFDLRVALLTPVDLQSGTLLGPPSSVDIPTQTRFGDVSTDVLGLYAFDRISFSDRFQLILGGRFDQIDFEGDGTANDREDDQFSPLAGVVFTPNERTSLYASFSQSFEPQSTLVTGDLLPEEGEQLEIGAKFDLGAADLTVAWYELEKENIAIIDSTGFPSQTGVQESRGVEVELVAELARGLDLRFGYAYTDAELTEFRELVFGPGPFDFAILDRAGNAPAWVPEHMANLWITQRFDSGFGFGFGGRYLDEQFIAPDNGFAVDDALILDAALFYTWDDLQLNLNVLNLNDEDYETRSFGPSAVSPAAGTEVRAGIRYLM
ncbi:MAG: TonB-dependent receptor [Acidobacteriota bacterium]